MNLGAKNGKYLILGVFLLFLLFCSISFVSAENISDDTTFTNSNLNSDLNLLSSNGTDSIDESNVSNISSQKNTVIIAKNMTILPKSSKYFVATLKDNDGNVLDNKTVTISINGKSYNRITNSKGQAYLKFASKVTKTYKTTVKFAGDSVYNKSSCNVNIVVQKFSTSITANNVGYFPNAGKYYKITLKDKDGTPLVNKTLKFYISTKVFTKKTNSNGEVNLKISIKVPKKYKVITKFAGTSQYLPSSKTSYILIKKVATTITAKSLYIDVNTKKNYVITLKDQNNNVLSNKKVKITINGRTYSKTTNSKGQATLPIKSSVAKTYDIVSTFDGDSYYDKSSVTNKIYLLNNRTPVVISLSDNKVVLGSNTNLTFTLKDNSQNILSNREFTVSLDNKVYTLITDDNGQASFNFKPTILKSYPMTINFEGDATYKDSVISSKIDTIKTTLTIQNNKIITEGFLRISLNSNYNTYISNKTVAISVDGDNFTRNTNNEGSIILKLNWTIKNYLISVSYDDYYCGLLTQTKTISCIEGNLINPLSGSVPLVNGVPDIDYMPSNYVWVGENNTYTLLSSQYKEVIKRDSYCLFLNNALSKYTFFQSKLEPDIYHIISREKWNIIEKAINTDVVKANKRNYFPAEVTVSIQGSGCSYCEVRDEQNTGYTCGPTSASTCTQVLRNYYNEAYLAILAGSTEADGSSTSGLKKALESCNMVCKYFYKSSWQTALNELAKGGCALVFHTWSHYIAIIDISPDKTKVLVSNPSGTYNEGSHGIPTNWVSVNYLYKYGFNNYDTSSLIVRLNYSLSQTTINQVNVFYKNMGGKWNRTNLNERPAQITNIYG